MKKFIYIAFLFIACGESSNEGVPEDIVVVENPMELVISFGDDGLEEEFLLAKPDGIEVDAAGNIYSIDENYVKIYDENGEPLRKFGGKGQGPGEFDAGMNMSISPTGYLTVMNVLWEYVKFTPGEHEYINNTRIKTDDRFQYHKKRNEYNFTMLEEHVYTIDDETDIIDFYTQNLDLPNNMPTVNMILMLKPDTLIELVRYKSISNFTQSKRNGSFSVKYQGDLLWDMKDKEHLVYTHTSYLKNSKEESPFYTLKVKNFYSGSEDSIRVAYNPEALTDSLRLVKEFFEVMGKQYRDNGYEQKKAILAKTEFFPPIEYLKVDGNMVYTFSYNWNKEEIRYVDVIDIEKGKIVYRTTMPFVPDLIKNGKVYRLKESDDAFPVIEVYLLNEIFLKDILN